MEDQVSGTVTVYNNNSNINYDSSAQYPVDIVKCLQDTSVTTTSILRFVHDPPNAVFCLEDVHISEDVIEVLNPCTHSSDGSILN